MSRKNDKNTHTNTTAQHTQSYTQRVQHTAFWSVINSTNKGFLIQQQRQRQRQQQEQKKSLIFMKKKLPEQKRHQIY